MAVFIQRNISTVIIRLSSVTMWESIVGLTMTSWLIFQHLDLLRECIRSAYYKIFIKTNYSTQQKFTTLRHAGGDISKCKQCACTTGALTVSAGERWGSYLENTILLKVGHKYIGCHCRHFTIEWVW